MVDQSRRFIGLVCATAVSAWSAACSGGRHQSLTADTGMSAERDGSNEMDQVAEVVSPVDVSPDAGTRVVLALDPGAPRDLALDQDYVYWTSYGAGTIQRVPKTGGAPELLAHLRSGGAPHLDVDDTAVYFNDRDDTGVTDYVGRVPKAGGPVTVIASAQFDPFPLPTPMKRIGSSPSDLSRGASFWLCTLSVTRIRSVSSAPGGRQSMRRGSIGVTPEEVRCDRHS